MERRENTSPHENYGRKSYTFLPNFQWDCTNGFVQWACTFAFFKNLLPLSQSFQTCLKEFPLSFFCRELRSDLRRERQVLKIFWGPQISPVAFRGHSSHQFFDQIYALELRNRSTTMPSWFSISANLVFSLVCVRTHCVSRMGAQHCLTPANVGVVGIWEEVPTEKGPPGREG